MRAKTKYSDVDIGSPRVVRDFLPTPDELAFREESVKVTIALSRRSVEFFKHQAEGFGTQYQRMIRRLLDAYVDSHGKPPTQGKPRKKRTNR